MPFLVRGRRAIFGRRVLRDMPRDHLSPDDALLAAAADVARSLRANDAYPGSRRGALAALKRRRPGFADERYAAALDAGIALFDAARRLVAEHLEARRSLAEPGPLPDVLVEPLAERAPGFRRETYVGLLNWVDLYYHRM